MLGLGYKIDFGGLDLVLGLGPSYSTIICMSTDYLVTDSVTVMLFGVGAAASVSYKLSETIA
ncbi:MAG: hypothetical protein A2087_09395 [Spirochaetes bacterium GWD1_61_31]|nr:MAG: hypothetical protein A2Y37_01420 [Spirochaetes bacterium GWB1_60_80]OHD30696.1 MAG: hypothetical protein A2004_11500 [Spirochaetes bacterium GWC1_61_12]OHD41265.1 MAG: hypothetical protein A2087_09395 [Spirochaetes bacterium GWD1_61_31]OHD45190.1 MAG: hypothetical protein A2Y35_10495 [Spirochaetes bacterium GWE1_60_18]OHD60164.1 MAG: hypothetical protein A2Y32_01760 [Spirochaetes bacterium GWF1_60_12]HAX36920.1 hypothetical protein [Spirochaetaceae bacterium]